MTAGVRKSELEPRLLEAVKRFPWSTAEDLAEGLADSPPLSSVSGLLQRLEKAGKLQRHRSGRAYLYALPEESRHHVEVPVGAIRSRLDEAADDARRLRDQVARRFRWKSSWSVADLARSLERPEVGLGSVLRELEDDGVVVQVAGLWCRAGTAPPTPSTSREEPPMPTKQEQAVEAARRMPWGTANEIAATVPGLRDVHVHSCAKTGKLIRARNGDGPWRYAVPGTPEQGTLAGTAVELEAESTEGEAVEEPDWSSIAEYIQQGRARIQAPGRAAVAEELGDVIRSLEERRDLLREEARRNLARAGELSEVLRALGNVGAP